MLRGMIGVLACGLVFVWGGIAGAESRRETIVGDPPSSASLYEQWRKTFLYHAIKEGMTGNEVGELLGADAVVALDKVTSLGSDVVWHHCERHDLTIVFSNHYPVGGMRVDKVILHKGNPAWRPLFW